MGKLCFSDVMFRHFGSKSGKCLSVSRMYRFEANHNPKAAKDVKLNSLQNVILRFWCTYRF